MKQKQSPAEALWAKVRHFIAIKEPPSPICPHLQKAIDACLDLESLKRLLLDRSIVKGEAEIKAFDKRLDELEQTQ
jgi:hypothetical protein